MHMQVSVILHTRYVSCRAHEPKFWILNVLIVQMMFSLALQINNFTLARGQDQLITSCISCFLQSPNWSLSKRPQKVIKALQDSRQDAYILRQLREAFRGQGLSSSMSTWRTSKQTWDGGWLLSAKCNMGMSRISTSQRDKKRYSGRKMDWKLFLLQGSQRAHFQFEMQIMTQFELQRNISRNTLSTPLRFHINIYCRGGIFYVHAITI